MGKIYLECRSLAVGYGGKPLISGIDLALERGSIMTLVGPNGSGKSTILKTVTRRIPPISGTVTLDGSDIRSLGGRALATKMASVLTDRIRPELETCFDIVSAGRYPYTGSFGLLTRRDREIVMRALSQVNAEDIACRDFASVSDGQRQRVLLARAIAQEPEIVVLDEPTSFLDIKHKLELLEILRDMAKERGTAVLMSLHEIDLASKISDTVVCVGESGISAFGSPEKVFSDESVRHLYGLERGSYNASLGCVELPPAEGTPKVFVIGGGGRGIPFYRALQKAGIPFSAGILFENDVDLTVAAPLAARVVTAPPFERIPEALTDEAKALIASSLAVIDAACPVGEFNLANAELLTYARSVNIPVLHDVSELRGVGI